MDIRVPRNLNYARQGSYSTSWGIDLARTILFALTILLFCLILSTGSYAQSTFITCSSDDMHRNYCDVGPNSGVRMVRQRSDARCTEGSTWGASRNQVWVDRGCRADFEVLPQRWQNN